MFVMVRQLSESPTPTQEEALVNACEVVRAVRAGPRPDGVFTVLHFADGTTMTVAGTPEDFLRAVREGEA